MYMRAFILPIALTFLLTSCGSKQPANTTEVPEETDTATQVEAPSAQDTPGNPTKQFVHSQYRYADFNSNLIIIENSYPKGGLKYTSPEGETYVYAVFWTRITNQTANPFELNLAFSEAPYELPGAPESSFQLFIPTETFAPEKTAWMNYGLDLEKTMDNKRLTQRQLNRTITSGSSSSFYIIALFNKGVEGATRTGLSIKGQRLQYRLNDKNISCGEVNLSGLKPLFD